MTFRQALDKAFHRVIPRDLFNEAKLFKGLGRLCLLIHDGKLPGIAFEHDGSPFEVRQCQNTGNLSVENVHFYRVGNGESLQFFAGYNSKLPYTLLFWDDEEGEVFAFNDDGEPTGELLELARIGEAV